MDYKDIKESKPNVWVVQEIAGTREGRPKFNIMGASEYGNLKFLLDERYYPIEIDVYGTGAKNDD
jgi:hypothetical protein